MRIYILSYIATAFVFLAIDAVWLSTMGNALYRPLLRDVLSESFNPAPAGLFYLLYIGGVIYFATAPAIASSRWTTALLNGALFGFFAYATYDLTNQATLKVWSTTVTIADLCWGTALTGVAATFGYLIAGAVNRAMG